MKKLLVFGLACLSLMSLAQADHRAGIFGSYIDQENGSGYGGGVKYEWMCDKNYGAEARISYLTGEDTDGNVIPLELGLVGQIPVEKVFLYAGIGGGYYIYQDVAPMIGGWDEEDPDPVFGFYVLGGLRYDLNESMILFGEIKYTSAEFDMEQSRTTTIPGVLVRVESMNVSGGLDGVGGNIGLLWRF